MDRPGGITITAVLMSTTNAMGWMLIDWNSNNAKVRFITFTLFILAGYLFIWFYWQGRNWARISVILCSLLAVANLSAWSHQKPGTIVWSSHLMIASEAALGFFLLYWLNTARIRRWFREDKGIPNS
jgi:hypothetical protein